VALTLFSNHAKKAGVRCAHITYRMTCEQYRDLEGRAAGCCEICRRLLDQPQIDHDAIVGRWAVRGLLCRRCNTQLESGGQGLPEQSRYLKAAWYLGVRLPVLPEPAKGSHVAGPYGRCWVRTRRGWEPTAYRAQSPIRNWSSLCSEFGAHNLTIFSK
jgi:hypothetical protein